MNKEFLAKKEAYMNSLKKATLSFTGLSTGSDIDVNTGKPKKKRRNVSVMGSVTSVPAPSQATPAAAPAMGKTDMVSGFAEPTSPREPDGTTLDKVSTPRSNASRIANRLKQTRLGKGYEGSGSMVG